MANPLTPLDAGIQDRLSKQGGVRCSLLPSFVETLSDYFAVFHSVVSSTDIFWFRGHADYTWSLTPSALRYETKSRRDKALALVSEFRRIAEIKLSRPPSDDEHLKWIQVARHYGLPTRLLDWTENALIALYFSCEDPGKDGMVFVLKPVDLNRTGNLRLNRILNPHHDAEFIAKYLQLDGRLSNRGLRTVAINPVWNSERIMLQRGSFTLHGSRSFALARDAAPSLVGLPILRTVKAQLRTELERVGVDAMTIFPELDYACAVLKKRRGL